MSTLAERPLLSRAELMRAANPSKEVSDSTFRRWQAQGWVSHGVKLHPRAGGRARGTVVLYSTLNRDALALHRRGEEGGARELRAAAEQVEGKVQELLTAERGHYAAWLQEMLRTEDPVLCFALRWPEQTEGLSRTTEYLRLLNAHLAVHLNLLLRAGRVEDLHEEFAVVVSEDERLVVPRTDLHQAGLDTLGAAVLVRLENLTRGRLLSVEPALDFTALHQQARRMQETEPDARGWASAVSLLAASPGVGLHHSAWSAQVGAGRAADDEEEDMPLSWRLSSTPVSAEEGRRLREMLNGPRPAFLVAPLPVRRAD
jgi:hypothetical protein